MASSAAPVLSVSKLPSAGPFDTPSPWLFCVYHLDLYPAGNAKMEAPRRGNGADFGNPSGWNMYHGDRVPGFPGHPHRGFETLTVTMEGVTDHFDSLGNAGRYGGGDLQWVTAGSGLQHSEMFPLVHQDKPNTLRLFQLWLNLPKKSKMAPGHFIMHWAEQMVKVAGTGGASATLVTGVLGDVDSGCTPPPESWAADAGNDVMVTYVSLPAGGSKFVLPPARIGSAANRAIYVTTGRNVSVGGKRLPGPADVRVDASAQVELVNGDAGEGALVLVLQGRPIDEPVAQRGPFVMNTQHEIYQAYQDFQRTEFGGWPWPGTEKDNTFPRDTPRHAVYSMPDGSKRTEYPPGYKPVEGAPAPAAKSEL